MAIDNKILEILGREEYRQGNTIELIASENFASEVVRNLCASVFTNKYAEGIPGRRFYNGCEHADEIERLAIEYATTLFGCQFANVQPHSGANANLAVFKALLKPGDVILGMDLSNGGHLSHGSHVNLSGAWFRAAKYTLGQDGLIDYIEVDKLAQELKPKLIIAGASNYSQVIDWARFRQIADKVGAKLLCDIAHYSGLIAGGQYPNPFPHAHIATSTTHKTLRGPRGGIILWNDNDLSAKINNAVFPGTQGGPLMHIIAAKAQCFHEALQKDFREYSRQVILNAKAMVEVFKENDVDIVSNGTECHMFTLDLGKESYSGRQLADRLEEKGITVNKNAVPGDTRSFVETSGIRIGTAAETTRGHNEEWFRELAQNIVNILRT
jgi:glycine hydroxymethyltransferase